MLILNSGGFNEKLFSFCKENILKNYATINSCIIPTAAKTPKLKRDSEVGTREYLSNKNIKNSNLFDFEYSDTIYLLYQYNFIIINGGNPFNLLYYVKKKKAENILLEIGNTNKIIVGISAGALLFTSGVHYIEEWYDLMGFPKSHGNVIGLKDLSGLIYKDLILFPHYDSFLKQNKNLEDELKMIEVRDKVSIHRLTDDKSIYFEEGKMIEI
ncbi:MAG: Type 1 glutamine amidotransferase-like domain-containing protein [Treponema sp.]|nr:Type 1 glutamine amidotransferase-like domain-containing protein [Treponema sp.]